MAQPPDRFVLSVVDWQTIVDALQDGVGVLDAEGRILACNEAAAVILGRSASQLVGRTPLQLDLGAVREDGTELPTEAYPSVTATRSATPVREQVIGVHDSDGRLRWVSVSATPMRRGGRRPGPVPTFPVV